MTPKMRVLISAGTVVMTAAVGVLLCRFCRDMAQSPVVSVGEAEPWLSPVSERPCTLQSLFKKWVNEHEEDNIQSLEILAWWRTVETERIRPIVSDRDITSPDERVWVLVAFCMTGRHSEWGFELWHGENRTELCTWKYNDYYFRSHRNAVFFNEPPTQTDLDEFCRSMNFWPSRTFSLRGDGSLTVTIVEGDFNSGAWRRLFKTDPWWRFPSDVPRLIPGKPYPFIAKDAH